MSDETMDVEEQVRRLNAALRLQFRSAIQYTLTAGGLAGFEFQPLAATPGKRSSTASSTSSCASRSRWMCS